MKKLFAALLAVTFATVFARADERPLLVGHRGSLWGLENSVESFTNGAKKGYEYLETDFKVTGDKQFVCTHDDDLTRLGGTKTIATSTLAELQSEPLTQTRSGVTYTGRLCSAQEFLDVCKLYNVKPLIELKWATGINSNDQSNIPMLIKFIEDNGFRSTCIILTSMKPCLEYIRKNYPDIKLQFLTGQYWANHFDWCVEQGIDVDIQAGYFDAACVRKFHKAGLIVNMWTANTNANYKTYAEMGCDMITTDQLDPANLPAFTVTPETPDPEPETETPLPVELVLERQWIMSNTTGNHPGFIDGTNAQQGTAVAGVFYVHDRVEKKVHMFDHTGHTGSLAGSTGYGCTRDTHGNIIIRTDALSGTGHSFMVYARGAKEGDAPAATFDVTVPLDGQTNFINASGNVLGAEGGYIYMFPNKQSAANIIKVAEGQPGEVTQSYPLAMTGSTAAYVAPVTGTPARWLYQVRTIGIHDYNNGNINSGYLAGRGSTTAPARNNTGGMAVFYLRGNQILVHNSGANYKGGFTVRNMSDGEAVVATVDPIGTLGYETGGNYSTFNWLVTEKVSDSEFLIYQYCPSNGIACYRLYDKLAGTDAIVADGDTDTNAAATYYNLQGQQVATPAAGQLVIRRQGGKATKVVVK